LRVHLDATQAHVMGHFRFEEQDGYMDTLRKREPRLDRAIAQLAEEHRQLAQSLNELIKEAALASDISVSLRQQIRGWIERVRQHEIRENEFVQDAFNLDIGPED
jgi:hypothetical protein